MNYHIFIDESGNTGNIEINEDLNWNFGIQTHFALGAICVAENKLKDLREEILETLHKYDLHLGDEKELKSKAKYKFKEELYEKLIDILISNKTIVFFDIANKKYKVIMNMVEYCIYPFYFCEDKDEILELRQAKLNVTTDLFNRMKEEDIKKFIDLCQYTGDEQDVIKLFLEFLYILENLFVNRKSEEDVKIQNNISRVIDFILSKNYNIKNILPIKDYNNKGSKESFLPNVDAYNNLIGLISQFSLSYTDSIYIHHDEQKQFSQVLFDWSDVLRRKGCNIEKVEFCDSKGDIMIQVSDFFTGNILRFYKEISAKSYLNRNDRELVKLLKPFLRRCNIVASNYEQHNFIELCNLRYSKTPIPFRD